MLLIIKVASQGLRAAYELECCDKSSHIKGSVVTDQIPLQKLPCSTSVQNQTALN